MNPTPSLLLWLCALWVLWVIIEAQDEQGHTEDQDVQDPQKQDAQEKNKSGWILSRHSRMKDIGDLEMASAGEKDFLAFISHDFDDDEYLDGTELLQAFTGGLGVRRPLVEVENTVDFLLHHHDENQDGKLSFFEFSKSFLPPSRVLPSP